jgi:hypothetical protein
MDQDTPRESAGNRLVTQENLAKTAQDLFSADFCAVQAVNPITERLYADAVIAGVIAPSHPTDSVQVKLKSLADRATQQSEWYIGDLGRLSEAEHSRVDLKEIATVAAVVFYTKREKKPMAVLLLGFRRPREFKKVDKNILELFVDQWSAVLENVWLLGRYREVVKIGQEINQSLSCSRTSPPF